MNFQERDLLAATGCEVRFDNATRQLYATDASLYQVEPRAVAFPRNLDETAAVLRAAAELDLPVTPRGAGTGLAGGAIGDGLILELADRHRHIHDFNLEAGSVRVEPGVVLDQLNAFLRPHGFHFGPDVATSSRATLGGMIANNSSGAHVPVYGTTADHLLALDVLLADGTAHHVTSETSSLPPGLAHLPEMIQSHEPEIRGRLPQRLAKRCPGYGLDRWLRHPGDWKYLLSGSEGTLAVLTGATLRISPLPSRKGLGLIFFASIPEAMQATVELLDLKPAAIEHIDRILFDQTRGQLPFRAARDLLELDDKPCESILMAEFYDEVEGPLAELQRKRLGLRTTLLTRPADMNLVWALRKAGLSLLTGCPGPAKPTTGIEDVAVPPSDLPEYVRGLRSILDRLGLEACFYGHAATGLLHVRPVLDLHRPGDVRRLRQAAADVADLVRHFKGSLTGEHGVGIARTEFVEAQLGRPLMDLHVAIKEAFDPAWLLNPGKIIDHEHYRYRIDTRLRTDADAPLELPFEPVLAFAAKDHSFVGNLEQCNGCGGCRKDAPTMCPTFAATGQEVMSTRGRANLIRAALEQRGLEDDADPLVSDELRVALSNCLSCKACTTECPSNVNLALLKAELLHARHRRHGLPLRERLVSAADPLGRLGCLAPELANAALAFGPVRWLAARLLGFDPQRPFPAYATERFDHWFERRHAEGKGSRGRVLLWDDTFTRYHEPHIGRAAVRLLETAGYQVELVRQRSCCGRPAFSQGHLTAAAQSGSANLEILSRSDPGLPILFLEPSCWSMFVEDYRELKLPGAAAVTTRCFLLEEFLAVLLRQDPNALPFRAGKGHIALHVHCHVKSLRHTSFLVELLRCLPGRTVHALDTGCCGMAGAFGMLAEKAPLSRQVAGLLLDQLNRHPTDTVVAASGTSCRHQIAHFDRRPARHIAEILADAL